MEYTEEEGHEFERLFIDTILNDHEESNETIPDYVSSQLNVELFYSVVNRIGKLMFILSTNKQYAPLLNEYYKYKALDYERGPYYYIPSFLKVFGILRYLPYTRTINTINNRLTDISNILSYRVLDSLHTDYPYDYMNPYQSTIYPRHVLELYNNNVFTLSQLYNFKKIATVYFNVLYVLSTSESERDKYTIATILQPQHPDYQVYKNTNRHIINGMLFLNNVIKQYHKMSLDNQQLTNKPFKVKVGRKRRSLSIRDILRDSSDVIEKIKEVGSLRKQLTIKVEEIVYDLETREYKEYLREYLHTDGDPVLGNYHFDIDNGFDEYILPNIDKFIDILLESGIGMLKYYLTEHKYGQGIVSGIPNPPMQFYSFE